MRSPQIVQGVAAVPGQYALRLFLLHFFAATGLSTGVHTAGDLWSRRGQPRGAARGCGGTASASAAGRIAAAEAGSPNTRSKPQLKTKV